MPMHKPGIVPRLQSLPLDQREALIKWLVEENLAYDKARARLKTEFGVQTSKSALSNFWTQVCEPRRFTDVMRAERERSTTVRPGRLILEIQMRVNSDNTLSISVSGPAIDSLSQTKTGAQL